MATKAEQRDRTRAEIVRIATRRFAERGYAGVALEDLVAEAGLTRGAVYHHFGSKEGLFRAVVEQAQAEVADAVARAADADETDDDAASVAGGAGAADGTGSSVPAASAARVRASFLAGCRAFLEASLAPGVRRILLVDGPAVLGWGRWREGDLATSARLLDEGVAELAGAGVIADRDLAIVSALISGALNEVAIARADASDADDPADAADAADATDATAEIDAAIATLDRMLAGLAPDPAP